MINFAGILLIILGILVGIIGAFVWVGSKHKQRKSENATSEGLGILTIFLGVFLIIIGVLVSGFFSGSDEIGKRVPTGYEDGGRFFGVLVTALGILIVIGGIIVIMLSSDSADSTDSTDSTNNQYQRSLRALGILALVAGFIAFLIGISLLLNSHDLIAWSNNEHHYNRDEKSYVYQAGPIPLFSDEMHD